MFDWEVMSESFDKGSKLHICQH